MNERPNQRWFPFRLSTWLMLIVIVAWFMAAARTDVPAALMQGLAEPQKLPQNLDGTCALPVVQGGATGALVILPGGERLPFVSISNWQFFRFTYHPENQSGPLPKDLRPNPALAWPTLALVAFLGWKLYRVKRAKGRGVVRAST